MARYCLFIAAVAVVYIGGFVYEEVGPVFYGLIITIIASTPLLLKFTFWKKIILMIPLLVLRVVGKILLKVFGKNALSKLLARYGLLERRFNRALETFGESKNQGIDRWKRMHRSTQAYLLLIFFPVALVLLVLAIIIKVIRLRFLQFIIEKLMQSFMLKWTSSAQAKLLGLKDRASLKKSTTHMLQQSDDLCNNRVEPAIGKVVNRSGNRQSSYLPGESRKFK